MKRKIILTSIGVLASIGLWLASGITVPGLDTQTDTYFNNSITKAGLAYATCRVINASVSIIKDSTLQLEPGGVGLSLAVGQALDPIDDMTERLSYVLVMAISALGVQKLAYEISVSMAPQIISVIVLLLSILIWFENKRALRIHQTFVTFLLVIAITRFFLPISSIANTFIHKQFFAPGMDSVHASLDIDSKKFEQLKGFSLSEDQSLWGTITNSINFLKQKSADFKNVLSSTVDNMADLVDKMLKFMLLYVGLFFIQILFLPLLSFWLLMRLVKL